MKKVVILNAPPSSGKDEVAKFISRGWGNSHHKEFKTKLFELTRIIYGVTKKQWDVMYTQELKEIPSELLHGLSPRQALINTSEVIIKPNLGKTYFGKAAAKTLDEGTNIFSDGGFKEELIPVIEASDDVLIIRIHRPEYTFERFGDSRSYLTDEFLESVGVRYVDVYNNGTLEYFLIEVERILIELGFI